MQFSSKSQNGLMVMLDIAVNQVHGPVPLQIVSTRQGISLSHVESLVSLFKRGGLVTSWRGPGGGYILSRDAGEISVLQVVEALEGPVDFSEEDVDQSNVQSTDAQPSERVHADKLWTDLAAVARAFLSSHHLAGLMLENDMKPVSVHAEPPGPGRGIHRRPAPPKEVLGVRSVFELAMR